MSNSAALKESLPYPWISDELMARLEDETPPIRLGEVPMEELWVLEGQIRLIQRLRTEYNRQREIEQPILPPG